MATVCQPDSLWSQQISVRTGILRGAPAHLILGSQALGNQASRCSSVRSPALPLPRTSVDGDELSNDGRCQEQEHLWQQFFLDPTMWWDNRPDKKSSRWPDFRRKGSGDVLWLDNLFKPAWVDEQLVSLDMQMGYDASASESSGGRGQEQERLWQQFFLDPTMWWDNRRDKKSSRSPDFRHKGSGEMLWLKHLFKPSWVDEQLVSLDMQMGNGASPFESSSPDKPEPGKCAVSEMGVVTAENVSTLCQQGELAEAVEALESLAQTDSAISHSLFCTVLKLCTARKDLAVGRRVHDLTVKLGYDLNASLGNHILRMYASGGRLKEAMDVFTRVRKPDAAMCFSMISAYTKHGKPKEAIQLYHEMCRLGVKANGHVFVAALQACAFAVDLESGRKVHFDILHSGIPPDLFVDNCLVDMYAKCGELKEARQVFDSMATKDVVTWNALISGYAKCGELKDARQVFDSMVAKDVVTWNALISGYAKCGELKEARQVFDSMATKNVVTWNALIAGYTRQGLGHEALGLYGQMEQEGLILANHVTFSCLLKACGSAGAIHKGRQLHSQIVKRGLLDNVVLGTCLVDMYAKCGELDDARQVFDSMKRKDVVTWTALISGYAQQGLGQEALVVYEQMEEAGIILADDFTFSCLLKACGSTGALQKGRQLHSQIVKRGLLDNVVLGTCLVDMYAKCGELEDARHVFDNMKRKDVVTWTALISGYAQQELGQEALDVYGQMEVTGLILADDFTFACLLKACGSTGASQKGRQLHSQIVEHGLLDNVVLGTSLVDMYARCGELKDARQVFDSMTRKNVVTWNALIAGYGTCDDGQRALACFEEMLVAGIPPDGATFTCLLVACSHEGLVDEGRKYFDSMAEQHGIKPTVEHYTCMIDLLGRAGHLVEAEKMLLSCDGQSDLVVLTSLLNACKSHGDLERATWCFESIVRLDPQHASAYVLMANAYADAGRWTDVDRIETQRRAAGANKKPAVATVEVERQVHTFAVGERRDDLALKVESTNARLKQEGGHVPHTKLVLKPLSEKEKEDALCGHAEKLALAFGLLNTPSGTPLVVTKNLRMCSDCHSSTEIMSRLEQRDIVVRDGYRVHRFAAGSCSCKGRP